MKKILGKFISYIPFIMLGVSFLSAFCCHLEFYPDLFMYLPDILGYSILTNLVFLHHFSFNKYCNVTRTAVYGLLLMNIVSIITKGTDQYSALYDIYIIGASIATMTVFKLYK